MLSFDGHHINMKIAFARTTAERENKMMTPGIPADFVRASILPNPLSLKKSMKVRGLPHEEAQE